MEIKKEILNIRKRQMNFLGVMKRKKGLESLTFTDISKARGPPN